jgi:hypothetical protein
MSDTTTTTTAAPPTTGEPGPRRPSDPDWVDNVLGKRWVRPSWRALGALYAVVTLVFGVGTFVSQLAHEEETTSREFDATQVRSIAVDNRAGRVRVVGDDSRTDTITVTARISEGLRGTGHSERIEGDRLVLETSCPLVMSNFCMVDYTIETPPGVDVSVSSETGASIEGIDGAVDVDTDRTAIEITDVSGPLRIDNDQGSVRASGLRSPRVVVTTDLGEVRLRFTEPPESVEAGSDQGSVEIVVPEDDTAYRLETSTDQGGIERDIRTDPDGDRAIIASTDQGDIVIRYP